MTKAKPIVVTGASGFIGKHITRLLIDEGFCVRATVRTEEKAEQTKATLAAHVRAPESLDKALEFRFLDLAHDVGWADTMEGARALIHTASPFPMAQPKDDADVIGPAVDGTARALGAAQKSGVERVILTSSALAIYNRALPAGRDRFDESDWSDLGHPGSNAYARAKILAEKAAWAFVKAHPDMKLTVINPSLVLGPALDRDIGTSLSIVARILSGKDPMLPNVGVSVVDVRDVARMHVSALQNDQAIGRRFIASERFLWFRDIASILRTEYPDQKIARRVAPDILLRMLALYDRSLRTIVPILGRSHQLSNAAACEVLNAEFIEARNAIKTSAQSLVRLGLVDAE